MQHLVQSGGGVGRRTFLYFWPYILLVIAIEGSTAINPVTLFSRQAARIDWTSGRAITLAKMAGSTCHPRLQNGLPASTCDIPSRRVRTIDRGSFGSVFQRCFSAGCFNGITVTPWVKTPGTSSPVLRDITKMECRELTKPKVTVVTIVRRCPMYE